MILKSFLLISFFILSGLTAAAQSPQPGARPPGPPRHSDSDQDINLPDEMKSRIAIERLEDEHRRFLEDVKRLDDLTAEVVKAYTDRKTLTGEELKKLGTIEKLAKRVLGRAGGSEVDDKKTESSPLRMEEAISALGAAVAGIKKSAMAETRHVISATVIGNSNEVINLAQFIRRTQKQGN
jgi:hypothetical protein